MTVLDDILDSSTDSSVPVSDLLRRVQIASTRLGASEIVEWARAELSGYPLGVAVPTYRELHTNVLGRFVGFRTEVTHQLSVPPEGLERLWTVQLRQPLGELQALAESEDGDPRRPWTDIAVKVYERDSKVGFEDHELLSAWNVITRQSLRGVVDIVRSRAMEFALNLQAQFPDAGEPGGPTVATNPELAPIVYNITNNITGHGTNLAAGQGAQQTSTVTVGDASSLLGRLSELGLSETERDEFVVAITEDNSTEGPRTAGFLARVRSGAVRLAEGFSTDVAAEVLIAAGRAYLGIHG